MEKERHLGLRIDQETLYKLHSVAEYEGRSANRQVLYIIRQYITSFEQQHGKIEYPPKAEE